VGFTNLPLVEVSVRFTLEETLPFGLPFIGELRDLLRGVHPAVEDAPFVLPPGSTMFLPTNIGQVGAVRFVGGPEGLILHVQPDLVGIFWSIASTPLQYPLHQSLFRQMSTLLAEIRMATGMESVPVKSVNMTYAKLLPAPLGQAADVVERYYGNSLMVPHLHNVPQFHELNVSWRTEQNIDLRFHVQYASVQIGATQTAGYTISDSGGMLLNGQSPMGGLEIVHTELTRYFVGSITKHAKKEWGFLE